MVSQCDDGTHLQELGWTVLEDFITDTGMLFHDLEFFCGQLAWLEQDPVLDSDLADIVHRCSHLDNIGFLR